jgi:hypothetical protein
MRNIRSTPSGIPAAVPQADAAYFYFLAEPVEASSLGQPDEVIAQKPLWQRRARVSTGVALESTMEADMREEETWLAFARPDLLVAASNRTFLELILKRMSDGASRQALPDDLPEWREVNRAAPFWGLRHYSEPGARRDDTNPKSEFGEPEAMDLRAIGVTIQYGVPADTVEVRYLSMAEQLSSRLEYLSNEFQVDRPREGIWRLRSNLRERGDFPFHAGMNLLGFGISY